ncbi:MAG: hypothetical protein IT530_18560 [Burkholderiales bacterium]|nr:hypothetical protein [Burkholderiales bacterium]
MLDELITAVVRGANLPPEQAALVVATVLKFLTARLPSSLVGELRARLGAARAGAPQPDRPQPAKTESP